MQSNRNTVHQQPGFSQSPPSSEADPSEQPAMVVYEIRVKGCKDAIFWSDWFGDMACTIDPDQGVITLCGRLADQAELYGLLNRLRSKGLNLISVQEIQQEPNSRNDDQAE